MLQCTVVVVVALCEQQTFTGNLAVTQACYLLSALFCRAALISEGCNLAGSVLQCTVVVVVALCEQQTFTGNLAVTQACYLLSALFCRAALISEGCNLAGSVLQCTVAGHWPSSKFSNSTLQCHKLTFRLLSAQQL